MERNFSKILNEVGQKGSAKLSKFDDELNPLMLYRKSLIFHPRVKEFSEILQGKTVTKSHAMDLFEF